MNTKALLDYSYKILLDSAKNIPDDAWETPGVCGVWTAKDVVGHVLALELVLVDVLASQKDNRPSPTLDQYLSISPEVYCHQQIEAYQKVSLVNIWEELRLVHQRAVNLVELFSEDELRKKGVLTWYGNDYSLEDFILYSDFGHSSEHAAQLCVFRDNLNRQPTRMPSKNLQSHIT